VNILLEVSTTSTYTTQTLTPYAEVWGVDDNGQEVPICWLSSANTVQQVNGQSVLTLELDLKWVSLANAKQPFTLKNVFVQDMDSSIPISTFTKIPVTSSMNVDQMVESLAYTSTLITNDMREGVNPMKNMKNANATASGRVILIHGYCASSNPWSAYAKDWTDADFYVIPNAPQSVTNDFFAKSIASYATSKGYTSYSVVGHSQGGMASAHLNNFYWSGMDNVVSTAGSRVVQSIGTPYSGNALAGTLAGLGDLFGVACGSCYDLTRDGASLWLRGITSTTRSRIYYYTTTYEQGKLFGDWCNLAANIALSWPNDGVAEYDYAHISGAAFQGNTEKQCHSEGMAYMSQCGDANRNKLMSNNAAR